MRNRNVSLGGLASAVLVAAAVGVGIAPDGFARIVFNTIDPVATIARGGGSSSSRGRSGTTGRSGMISA
jgi:hypothetical protein